ncbi:MAG: hypothetical protein J5787_05815 [Alphaproteobacteria bacterium]|nr:hypothetical protein [Alphaproteobacteria bacterium]
MTQAQMLAGVKDALGIGGTYQDNTITQYIDEVMDYLKGAGVDTSDVRPGLVARGVSDLWNYGTGTGKLSEYFMQRATQMSYKGA